MVVWLLVRTKDSLRLAVGFRGTALSLILFYCGTLTECIYRNVTDLERVIGVLNQL